MMDISPIDEEPPVITCPSNQTVYNDIGRLFATVELADAHSYCDESATLSIAVADSISLR